LIRTSQCSPVAEPDVQTTPPTKLLDAPATRRVALSSPQPTTRTRPAHHPAVPLPHRHYSRRPGRQWPRRAPQYPPRPRHRPPTPPERLSSISGNLNSACAFSLRTEEQAMDKYRCIGVGIDQQRSLVDSGQPASSPSTVDGGPNQSVGYGPVRSPSSRGAPGRGGRSPSAESHAYESG
jgi:hypothetical protein